MLNIKFKFLKENCKPSKSNKEACCYDVYATSKTITKKYIEYGLGFKTEIPKGYKGIIVPRSSVSNYDLIMCNSPAQIDSDYRGEWKVRFKRLKWFFNKEYNIGDRIAQIYFIKELNFNIFETEYLKETDRNELSFGSSGV